MRPPDALALVALALAAGCAAAPVTPAPPPPPPPPPRIAFATAGWVKPQEAAPGCVARAFVPPPGWKAKGKATAKIAVDPAGKVARFEDVSEPPDPSGLLAEALSRAVAACAFVPGKDPAGRAATIWLLLPVPVVPARR